MDGGQQLQITVYMTTSTCIFNQKLNANYSLHDYIDVYF
jgi:hypothetical protein